MNPAQHQQLVIGHALLWMAAIATPVAVQVALDWFDRESAGSVAIGSALVIFVLFGVAHLRLVRRIGQATDISG